MRMERGERIEGREGAGGTGRRGERLPIHEEVMPFIHLSVRVISIYTTSPFPFPCQLSIHLNLSSAAFSNGLQLGLEACP